MPDVEGDLTMAETDDSRKARLSPTKRALLDAWVGGAADDAMPPPSDEATAGPDERYEPFPLTEVQEAYWLGRHRVFELGTIPSSYIELEVPALDVDRLQLALENLVRRHDMLRAIVLPDGRQRVLPTTPRPQVGVYDLRGLSETARASRRNDLRREMTRQIADPGRWPLFAVAVSLGDDGTLLHVMFDILIVDMQSVRVLTRDLARLYGDPSASLPPVRASFREIALARAARKASASYGRARAYWLDRLDALPPPPPLPLACSPRDLRSPGFVRHVGGLDRARWDEVKRRAATLKLTATAPLLTVFAQVLARRSASSRFTINVTTYNRPAEVEQIDEVVGDFTSLTLLECDLSIAEPFRDRALRLQRRLWSDLEHRDFDGVEVLRERMGRLGTRSATMPIVFTSNLLHDRIEASPAPAPPLGRVVTAITQTPQVWIDHQAAEQDGALVYSWDVVGSLFPPGLVEEMLAEYQQRIETLCDDPAWQDNEALVTVCTAIPSRIEAPITPHEPPTVRARDHVLARVVARAEEVLGGRTVPPDAPLLELGLTSIGMVRLANALDADLRVRPEMEELFERSTASAIASLYDELIDRAEPSTAKDVPDDGLILDPDERLAFVRARRGLRRDLEGRPWVPLDTSPNTELAVDLAARRTCRSFSLKQVSLASFGGVLAAFRADHRGEEPRYLYPSAGGLYPIQVYLHVKPGRIEHLAGGYYYDPSRHALASLAPDLELERRLHGWNNRAAFDQCAFSLLFVLDERAMQPLYGRLTRELALIESGAMLQLAMLVGISSGIGLCPVGRFDASPLREALAWHDQHVLLHTVLGGIPATIATGDAIEDLLREVDGLTDAEVEALLARRGETDR